MAGMQLMHLVHNSLLEMLVIYHLQVDMVVMVLVNLVAVLLVLLVKAVLLTRILSM